MAVVLAALAAFIGAPSALGLDAAVDATAVDTTAVATPAVVDPAPVVTPDPVPAPAPVDPVVVAPDPAPAPAPVDPVVVTPAPAPTPAPVAVVPDPTPAPVVVAPAPDPPAPVAVAPPVVIDVPVAPSTTSQDPVLPPIVQQITLPQPPETGVLAKPDDVPVAAPPVPMASAATPAGVFPMQAMQAARREADDGSARPPVDEVAEATPVAAPGLGLLPGGADLTGSRIAGLLAFMMGFLPFAPLGGKLGIGPPPHLAVLLLGMLLAVAAAFSYTLRDVRRREPRGFATLALRPG